MRYGLSILSSMSKARFMRVTGGGATVLFVISCLAPKAEPIGGDVLAAIEKGIDEGTGHFDHGIWDEILKNHAKENGRKFDYVGLKKEEAKLDYYLRSLADVELSSLSRNELLALFANAYNAYTVKSILEHISTDGTYAIKSIRDISDVFDIEKHRVGGFTLSLNNMEHNILRPLFKDPRIHFAVNCASISCPPIPIDAFRGASVDRQLDEATESVLSSPDYVRVEDGELKVSKILQWYGSDFVSEGYKDAEKDLKSFIRKFTSGDVRKWIDSHSPSSVKFMKYDWNLNRS
jgi:hypothetical protein